MAPELSVVIPVYRCAACLPPLHARLTDTLNRAGISFEVLFVDDASPDNAAEVLHRLASENPSVLVVTHEVNQGQHAAIAEGMQRAGGRFAAVLDCDLQDPPELLPEMLRRARGGAPIVVGRRRSHGRRGWRRVATSVFGVLARRRLRSQLVGTHSVFSVLSRHAIDGYLMHPDRRTMYLPVLESLRLPIESIDYDRAERRVGRSGYRAAGLVRRAWRLLLAPRSPGRDELPG